jgi:putative oxidoreductase
MKKIFTISPIWQAQVLATIRIIIGALLIYHGKEIFSSETMNEYTTWDIFKTPNGKMLVYLGKSCEFIAGISLLFGLLTRLGAIVVIGTFSYITFFIGHGKFWYEDQHPFMFALFGWLFLFTGPGAWSIDGFLFKENK